MTDSIELKHGALRCEIAPALGGCLAGLWLGDTPVLRSTPAPGLTSVRESASYPLVPFSNRIGQAQLQWHGTGHPLLKNFEPEPHAIHGLGWQRPWQVLAQDPDFALLSFEHQADASWPFAFDSSQAFRLDANGLSMTLSMTNQSDTPAPAGLGWHPYFVKRARSHISFSATGRWEMGLDKLPTHRLPSQGLNTDCTALQVDHCFDGWPGTLHLRDELLEMTVSANLSRLVVYTHGALDCVAIEPVSHANNALNLLASGAASADELGVRVLQPGESMSAQMTIQVKQTP